MHRLCYMFFYLLAQINGKSMLNLTYVSILVLVVIFFTAGVFVGSILVERTPSARNIPGQGLPGTRNVMRSVTALLGNQTKHLRTVDGGPYSQPEIPSISGGIGSIPASANVVTHRLRSNTNIPPNARVSDTKGGSSLAPLVKIDEGLESRKYSMHTKDTSFMVTPSDLDNEKILVSAWIYLDDSFGLDSDMRTIISNKQPGCDATKEQYGLALYVNGWQTNDHKLYCEYGGASLGCYKIDSKSVQLSLKRWYHVAVYVGPHYILLFIDGELVNKQALNEPRQVQRNHPWRVGQYAIDAPYPFYGNISNLAIVHGQPTEKLEDLPIVAKNLQEVSTAKKVPGLAAFYPLTDAIKENPNSKAADIIGDHHGRYEFPIHGHKVSGLSFTLIDGVGGRPVTDEMKAESDKLGRQRREKIKDGMRHVWAGYKKFAWGADELKPLSNRGHDNWGGMGVTLVDSLDTLWVMGLKKEFEEARDWVATQLSFKHAGTVSVFETTIRELGGLLAAYDLSGDRVFLEKAKELGDKLIGAFGTSSGIPTAMVHLQTGSPANGWSGDSAILSELGTLQIEFRYLGFALHDPHYETISMKPLQLMGKKSPNAGLYPIKIRISDGGFAESQVTFGALGDSFFEYLLKVWIQGGRKENWLREMYDRAMNGAMAKLLKTSVPGGLAFFSDWNGRSNNRKMDHLVCFVPGLLALGAYTNPEGMESERSQRDLAVAKAMMFTCREMYHRMPTGISAEYVEFPERGTKDFQPGPNVDFYILRPETAESLFILNQLTGDPIYREWAWEIWEAIDKHCKTPSGYASLSSIFTGQQEDRMESFFLAETMKYLYLAQDPDRPIDLMKYVFNTEAHPTKIFDDSHTPTPL